MAHRINVTVKMNFHHEALKKILPVGHETTLEPTYENDKFTGYVLKGADGEIYSESEIYRFIGDKPLSEIFNKR